MRIYWEKTVKIVSASGPPPLNPLLPSAAGGSASDPRFVTPAYYYNIVESFSAKCILFISKKEPSNYSKCFAFASSALLHLYFNSNSQSFVEGVQEYFLPQGAGYPSYATEQESSFEIQERSSSGKYQTPHTSAPEMGKTRSWIGVGVWRFFRIRSGVGVRFL